MNWSYLNNYTDPNEIYEHIVKEVNNIYEGNVKKNIAKNNKTNQPKSKEKHFKAEWMTTELLKKNK